MVFMNYSFLTLVETFNFEKTLASPDLYHLAKI